MWFFLSMERERRERERDRERERRERERKRKLVLFHEEEKKGQNSDFFLPSSLGCPLGNRFLILFSVSFTVSIAVLHPDGSVAVVAAIANVAAAVTAAVFVGLLLMLLQLLVRLLFLLPLLLLLLFLLLLLLFLMLLLLFLLLLLLLSPLLYTSILFLSSSLPHPSWSSARGESDQRRCQTVQVLYYCSAMPTHIPIIINLTNSGMIAAGEKCKFKKSKKSIDTCGWFEIIFFLCLFLLLRHVKNRDKEDTYTKKKSHKIWTLESRHRDNLLDFCPTFFCFDFTASHTQPISLAWI